jgi:hypothetical protein
MARKDMETELRELRKTSGAKPVSKMKLFEISAEIERLKHRTETTPASASYTTKKSTPVLESKVKDVKKAKEAGFPVAPKKSEKVVKEKVVKEKAKVSKTSLRAMLDELSSDEE